MPRGANISGLESDGREQFFCGDNDRAPKSLIESAHGDRVRSHSISDCVDASAADAVMMDAEPSIVATTIPMMMVVILGRHDRR
jgi:hypothetical protein